MATALRLVMPVGLTLLLCGAPAAQPPVAPAPHPSLDELVKEYRRCGLPVPPPEAELVQIRWWNHSAPYILSLRVPAPEAGGPPRFLTGNDWWPMHVQSDRVRLVQPTPAARDGVSGMSASQLLCLAAQCKICGWDPLAETLY